MRIVYDYQIFVGQEYGGVSRYFYELAKRIPVQIPCDLKIWAPLYRNGYLKDDPTSPVEGVYFPAYPYTGKMARSVSSILSQVRARLPHFKPIDVWHQTYFWEGSRGCSPRGAKRILTVYDMIHEKFPDSFPPGDLTSEWKARATKSADHIICISEQTKNDLMEILNVPEKKITVTYLSYNLMNHLKAPAGFSLDGKPFILYAGPRIAYKNFSRLQEAFASSPELKKDFQLICFGGGPFSSAEKARLGELGLTEENVTQIAGSDAVLSMLYQKATMFVYPSLYEGFGIPPLEAMSLGCPVVTSQGGSLREVVGDAAELIDPLQVDSLRSAIGKLAFSEPRRAELKKLGMERIKLFSWDKCARETFNVYQKA